MGFRIGAVMEVCGDDVMGQGLPCPARANLIYQIVTVQRFQTSAVRSVWRRHRWLAGLRHLNKRPLVGAGEGDQAEPIDKAWQRYLL